mgnify:FL=1|jgi:hypothetical protein|nr:MAG TPA: hypothetical protein [Caudoviricetes sp.]
MAKTNADNAFMAGSEKDTLYLGPAGTDLSTITSLTTPMPEGMVDVGWTSDDGMTLDMSDSVDKIRGHQGHGVVRTYMSDSSTSFKATLLETKLELLKKYLGATKAEKVTTTGTESITRMTVSASRKVETLCGVADLFDVSTGKQRRYIFPRLELGERSGVTFKVGELSAYEYNLEVLDKYELLSNEDGLKVG